VPEPTAGHYTSPDNTMPTAGHYTSPDNTIGEQFPQE